MIAAASIRYHIHLHKESSYIPTLANLLKYIHAFNLEITVYKQQQKSKTKRTPTKAHIHERARASFRLQCIGNDYKLTKTDTSWQDCVRAFVCYMWRCVFFD